MKLIKCSPEAREKCKFDHPCDSEERAFFEEGSPCDAFNKSFLPSPKMTNADRIRAMTDEELAKHLNDIGWDCHLCAEHKRLDNEPLLRGERCDEKCVEHCLNWLKQPYGGADHEPV